MRDQELRAASNPMNMQTFACLASRIWTGRKETPLERVLDADERDFEVIESHLRLQRHEAEPKGLLLATDQGRGLLLPASAFHSFAFYAPSPLSCSVLIALHLDGKDTQQQCFFFGRLMRSRETLDPAAEFSDPVVARELLAALHAWFPETPLAPTARELLAQQASAATPSSRKPGAAFKRRKSLTAESFYGSPSKMPVTPRANASEAWQRMYEQLQFRVSQSLMCQLEGTAAVSSTFPRQQEAFEFADQIQAFRSRPRSSSQPDPRRLLPQTPRTDNETTPRVFSFESANGGKRRFLVTSMDAFWDSYSKTLLGQRHVYEIIRERVPCRLYFDLEFKTKFNPTVSGNELVVRLIALVQLQLYRLYHLHVRLDQIVQLDSSTPAKFSRHLIFHLPDGALFADNLQAGAFVRQMIQDLIEDSSDSSTFLVRLSEDGAQPLQLFIDTGVYTRNRMFRVLGSSKYRSNAVLAMWPEPRTPVAHGHTPSEFDRQSFLNSLVCPFASLQSFQSRAKVHRIRLLRCHENEDDRRLLRFVSSTGGRVSSNMQAIECRQSIFPELDQFVRSQAVQGGVQGEIRSIQVLIDTPNVTEPDPTQHNEPTVASPHTGRPWMLIYHMARNRWCGHVRRAHRSNNVMFIVDLMQQVIYQKCHDPQCQAIDYRSSAQPLPPALQLALQASTSAATEQQNPLASPLTT